MIFYFGISSMLKRILLLTLPTVFSSISLATPLWHCTASNVNGAVWNQYGLNHLETRRAVDRACVYYNDHKPCEIVCFPPREYWRCLSHDTIPTVKENAQAPKQGTWYWTSFSKQIAINGARDACRHNSGLGGCHVNPDSCSQS